MTQEICFRGLRLSNLVDDGGRFHDVDRGGRGAVAEHTSCLALIVDDCLHDDVVKLFVQHV